MNESTAANKGYLRENFRLFHLKDRRAVPVESHYHEFDKVVLFISGEVDYTVEGVSYALRPGDVLFVRHHDVHRPEISEKEAYERIILWIAPEFLKEYRDGEQDLESCFDAASVERSCRYHPSEEVWTRLRSFAGGLELAMGGGEFGREMLCDAYFLQLLVELNRCVLREKPSGPEKVDRAMDAVLRYINTHLDEELTVESLAAMSYLSRYYFMRRFKEATGYTVHSYIQLKRLTAAAEHLVSGMNAGDAAAKCGFGDYSAFLRAFRKQYGVTPTALAKSRLSEFDSKYSE